MLTLRDRLGGAMGREVQLRCIGGTRVDGIVRAVGRDWLLVAEGPLRTETLLASANLVAISGVGYRSSVEADLDSADLAAREQLAFRHLVRGLGRDRAPVAVTTVDGSTHSGTFDRIGRDHADLAIHPMEVARRPTSVTEIRILTLSSIVVIRVSRT